MKNTFLFLFPLLFILTLSRCNSSEEETVAIGDQVWMKSNLNVDHFRNGDPIPEAKNASEWKSAGMNKEPVWCYYDYDPKNGEVHGKLYNWYAVNDSRGLAPEGFKIPSNDDWNTLAEYLEGTDVAGKKMKNNTGWPNNGNGNNESGFSGLGGGNVKASGGFRQLESMGQWWSATEKDESDAYYYGLRECCDDLDDKRDQKTNGFSVRCIKE